MNGVRKLTQNLYCRNGYYSYRDPASKVEYGLGRNHRQAVALAIQANLTRNVGVIRAWAATECGLLSERTINKRSTPIKIECGVYFLLREGRVVYVGRSVNCARRIRDHWSKPHINFDAFCVLACDAEAAEHLEARYINKFRPIFNFSQSGHGKNPATSRIGSE